MPELLQHSLPEARELTAGAKLELRVRGQSPADETLAVVASQRPAAGTRVAAKSIVLVELGPALIAVPDLRKHPLDEARQMLSKAGFGALLAAAGAALGVARWRGVRSHATGLPAVRVVANSDVGKQEIHANGTAGEGFALRLRSRIDAGAQTVEANGRIVAEERRVDG